MILREPFFGHYSIVDQKTNMDSIVFSEFYDHNIQNVEHNNYVLLWSQNVCIVFVNWSMFL